MQDILGDMLITSPWDETETVLPSPNQLKYKIIIKNKKLPEAGGNNSNNTNDDEADSDFEEEQFINEISSGILINSHCFIIIYSNISSR